MTSRYTKRGKTYYDDLEVKRDSTKKEIKDAFINLSKKCHPDTLHGSHERYLKIIEAYQTLSKQHKRKEYDRYLQSETGNDFNSNYKRNPDYYYYYQNQGRYQYSDPGVKMSKNFKLRLTVILCLLAATTANLLTVISGARKRNQYIRTHASHHGARTFATRRTPEQYYGTAVEKEKEENEGKFKS